MRRRAHPLCLFATSLAFFFLLTAARSASAATFTVDSLDDVGDAGSNGVCATPAGACTLRAALQEASVSSNPDTINFSVTGTINLNAPLPNLVSVTINGPGSGQLTVKRLNGFYSIFTTSGTVSVSGLTISNGNAGGGNGGGVYNTGTLTMTDIVVSGNFASYGGGIFNYGALTMTDVTVSGNTSNALGGGILNEGPGRLSMTRVTVSGNTSTNHAGGGIFNVGLLTMTNSTVSGNSALGYDGAGGGIYAYGRINLAGVTVSGNSSYHPGGGIFFNGSGQGGELKGVTVAGNRATGNVGGGIYSQHGDVLLRSTLVSRNFRGPANTTIPDDLYGAFRGDGTYNLVGACNCGLPAGPTNKLNVLDPKLGDLADNGGPTKTHALLAGSPALDAGTSTGLGTDQRGAVRIFDDPSVFNASGGDGADIGAFEALPADDHDGVPDVADACPGTPVGATVGASGCPADECLIPPPGMTSWWAGDDNAQDFIGNHHGTAVGGASYAAGKVGQAFSLDGINDYFYFGTAAGNFATSNFSIDFWVKSSSAGRHTLLGKREGCTSGRWWDAALISGKIVFSIEDVWLGPGVSFSSNSSVNDGEFHHVTLVREGSVLSIYIDGVLDKALDGSLAPPFSSSITGPFLSNTAPLLMGISPCLGSGGVTAFGGQLDEVELFGRALAPQEIKALFEAGSRGKCKTADLSITKTPSRDPAVVDRVLTYTLAVSNLGPDAASNVTVTDNLPTNAAYVSTVTPQGTCSRSGSTVTCQLGSLAAGQSVEIEVRVKPNQPATLTNTASVASPTRDPDTSNNSRTVQTQAVIAADLSVKKVASKSEALVNQIFNYKLTVKNDGPAEATGVAVTDGLPAGLSFSSVETTQGSCAHSSGLITCQLGSLASGATAVVTIKVKPRQPGTLTNTATVTGDLYDQDTTNNSATVTTAVIASADLSVRKRESADPVLVGQQFSYVISVTNLGFVQATGVSVTDALPASMTFVSASSSQGTVTSAPPAGSTGTVMASLGSLAVGATAAVTITVEPSQAGVFTNTATVSGEQSDHDTTNNTHKQQTTVVTLQKLLLSSTAVTGGCQPYPTGQAYLTGPAPAGGVTVTLSSTTGAASVPASVFIAAGQVKSGAFTVTTLPVTSLQTGAVRATLGGKTVGRGLTVSPGTCP